MVIDLVLLKRALHRRRMSMREFFRLARLSRTERACILHGVCVLSYTVARMCLVLDCRQADLFCVARSAEKASTAVIGDYNN